MAKVRIPLVGSPSNRLADADYDQRFVNCFPEVINNPATGDSKVYLLKRDGVEYVSDPGAGVAEGRGIYAWNSKIYSVVGNKLYSNTTAIQTLTTSTGTVGFCEWSAASDYLVLLDGTKGYYVSTTDVVTEITDAQFPTPHIPKPVFFDSYLFVQKTTGEIFNSNASDLTAWEATSYITPVSFPSPAVGISRQNNLLVALSDNSVEFFYDAANPTPGSPLLPNSNVIVQYGCASLDSICENEGLLIFVAQSYTGGKFVVALEGTRDTTISTEAINRILYAEGTNITDCYAYLTRMKGHLLYVLNLPSQSRTLVFDLDTKIWHEWEYAYASTDGVMPFLKSTEYNDQQYLIHVGNGNIYRFSPDQYRDIEDSTPTYRVIKLLVQTLRVDLDTGNLKFMDRLEVLADWASTTSSMSIYWSDDDYKTWSSARTVNLQSRAYLYRCGSFRRRAFRLYSEANTPIRLFALETDVRGGVH